MLSGMVQPLSVPHTCAHIAFTPKMPVLFTDSLWKLLDCACHPCVGAKLPSFSSFPLTGMHLWHLFHSLTTCFRHLCGTRWGTHATHLPRSWRPSSGLAAAPLAQGRELEAGPLIARSSRYGHGLEPKMTVPADTFYIFSCFTSEWSHNLCTLTNSGTPIAHSLIVLTVGSPYRVSMCRVSLCRCGSQPQMRTHHAPTRPWENNILLCQRWAKKNWGYSGTRASFLQSSRPPTPDSQICTYGSAPLETSTVMIAAARPGSTQTYGLEHHLSRGRSVPEGARVTSYKQQHTQHSVTAIQILLDRQSAPKHTATGGRIAFHIFVWAA